MYVRAWCGPRTTDICIKQSLGWGLGFFGPRILAVVVVRYLLDIYNVCAQTNMYTHSINSSTAMMIMCSMISSVYIVFYVYGLWYLFVSPHPWRLVLGDMVRLIQFRRFFVCVVVACVTWASHDFVVCTLSLAHFKWCGGNSCAAESVLSSSAQPLCVLCDSCRTTPS